MAEFAVDGAVDLYYNGTKKFETTNEGATVTGKLTVTGTPTAISLSGNIDMNDRDIKEIRELSFGANAYITSPSNSLVRFNQTSVDIAAGDLTVSGDLTVGGNIIHGGVIPAGGSVSAKGGVFNFNKSIGPNLSQQQLFSILRPGTGAIAFRVTLTSGASAAVSRTKIFEVAHCFGTGAVFNQVIDSGPNTSVAANDFNVSFSTSTNGGATTAGANSGQAVIPVSSTDFAVGIKVVQVGGGINRIPAGARIISMANQGSLGATITLDTNLTGFLSQGTTVGCVPDDIVVCKITPQNTTTQTISATVELGYDNNTTATILST